MASHGRTLLTLRQHGVVSRHRDEDTDGLLKPIIPSSVPDYAIPAELAYRTFDAKRRELLSQKRQLDAELADSPSKARATEIGQLMHKINSALGHMRTVVRDAGELAYATVYMRIAEELLTKEARILIGRSVDEVMKRGAWEIVASKAGDDRYSRVKGWAA